MWNHFVPRFGKKYTLSQLKTRWRSLGKQYKLWKELLGPTTGASWDEEMETLLADDAGGVAELRCLHNLSSFSHLLLFPIN